MYYYLFYKIYKAFRFIEPSSQDIKVTKVKAATFLSALEVLTMLSIVCYKSFIFQEHDKWEFFSFKMLAPLIIVFILDRFVLSKNDNWMRCIEKFDKWPKEKNKKGTLIVIGVIVLIFANFALSGYLLPIKD